MATYTDVRDEHFDAPVRLLVMGYCRIEAESALKGDPAYWNLTAL